MWTKLVRFVSVFGNCTVCTCFGDIWRWNSVAGFHNTDFARFDSFRCFRMIKIRCYRILRPSFNVKYPQTGGILYNCEVLREISLVWLTLSWNDARCPITSLIRRVFIFFEKGPLWFGFDDSCYRSRSTTVRTITETKMSSFWRNFHHWLHRKLSFWQLSVQPVMKIISK